MLHACGRTRPEPEPTTRRPGRSLSPRGRPLSDLPPVAPPPAPEIPPSRPAGSRAGQDPRAGLRHGLHLLINAHLNMQQHATHADTHIHVMSCHGALEPSSAGPPSGRPSAERLAVTHTRTPMEWAPGEGGPRAPCMARRREAPGPSKVHHGQASGRSETPVPPTGPGFLGTGGSHL